MSSQITYNCIGNYESLLSSSGVKCRAIGKVYTLPFSCKQWIPYKILILTSFLPETEGINLDSLVRCAHMRVSSFIDDAHTVLDLSTEQHSAQSISSAVGMGENKLSIHAVGVAISWLILELSDAKALRVESRLGDVDDLVHRGDKFYEVFTRLCYEVVNRLCLNALGETENTVTQLDMLTSAERDLMDYVGALDTVHKGIATLKALQFEMINNEIYLKKIGTTAEHMVFNSSNAKELERYRITQTEGLEEAEVKNKVRRLFMQVKG